MPEAAQTVPPQQHDFVEVIYNTCYGGYSFSKEAIQEYRRRLALQYESLGALEEGVDTGDSDLRTDPIMVGVVKEMGPRSYGTHAELKIAQVPLRFAEHYVIEDYDGYESVSLNWDEYRLTKISKAVDQSEPCWLAEMIRSILDEPEEEGAVTLNACPQRTAGGGEP